MTSTFPWNQCLYKTRGVSYTPVLIDAGFPELDIPIPWWNGRSLRFGFPPR